MLLTRARGMALLGTTVLLGGMMLVSPASASAWPGGHGGSGSHASVHHHRATGVDPLRAMRPGTADHDRGRSADRNGRTAHHDPVAARNAAVSYRAVSAPTTRDFAMTSDASGTRTPATAGGATTQQARSPNLARQNARPQSAGGGGLLGGLLGGLVGAASGIVDGAAGALNGVIDTAGGIVGGLLGVNTTKPRTPSSGGSGTSPNGGSGTSPNTGSGTSPNGGSGTSPNTGSGTSPNGGSGTPQTVGPAPEPVLPPMTTDPTHPVLPVLPAVPDVSTLPVLPPATSGGHSGSNGATGSGSDVLPHATTGSTPGHHDGSTGSGADHGGGRPAPTGSGTPSDTAVVHTAPPDLPSVASPSPTPSVETTTVPAPKPTRTTVAAVAEVPSSPVSMLAPQVWVLALAIGLFAIAVLFLVLGAGYRGGRRTR